VRRSLGSCSTETIIMMSAMICSLPFKGTAKFRIMLKDVCCISQDDEVNQSVQSG
jgi:hypothetical protein